MLIIRLALIASCNIHLQKFKPNISLFSFQVVLLVFKIVLTMDQEIGLMTPPNNFVKELRGVLDQQNILSAKTKQKGNKQVGYSIIII